MARALDDLDRLGRLGIFADLSAAELHAVAAELDEESFPEGHWVLRRDGAPSDLFVIVSGEVGILVDGEERATLTTGGFFGEVSALLDEPVTADVVARSRLHCLVIPAARVGDFLIAHPRVMFRMFQTEARRLRTSAPERN
jgi:type IV pilus assembly protein PilB